MCASASAAEDDTLGMIGDQFETCEIDLIAVKDRSAPAARH